MAATKRRTDTGAESKSDRIRHLLGSGLAPAEIAKKVGCSRNLVYAVKGRLGAATTRKPGRAKASRKGSRSMKNPALGDLIGEVRAIQDERERMRKALDKIAAVLNGLT